MVFVHGGLSDGRMWQPQLDSLADAFTVVAWDEPGAGRSADLPQAFGLDDYADCLAAFIEQLELGPAGVVGHSWGGTLSQALYARHPELVASLILYGSYAGWKGSLPEAEVRARMALCEEMIAAPPAEFDPNLPGLFAGDAPAEYVELLEAMARDVRMESVEQPARVMAETDQRELLPQITAPTLLIWGESDARSPLTVAHQFKEAIPNAELVVLPGAGHMSNLEQPELFTAAIRRFLERR